MKSKSILLLIAVYLPLNILSQTNGNLIREEAVDVFFDCHYCDIDFVKEQIRFVNFVRDRKEADIHIISNSIRTGGGGRQFTLTFLGLNEFNNINDTLTYISNVTDTDDSERLKMVNTLKLGLIRYINKTPLADHIEINFLEQNVDSETDTLSDPWNFWVFRTSVSTDLNGEQSAKFTEFDYSFTATRITEDWKIRVDFDGEYEESKFDYEGEEIVNITRSQRSYNHIIKSVSDHWSIGGWVFMHSSTYNNLDFKISVAPGVEYNIFPYSDFNTKQLRFEYKIWNKYHNYHKETIYLKDSEFLFEQTISATLDLVQPWGSISTSAHFSNHLHDWSLNSTRIRGRVSLQLVKGLELTIRGGYSAIHDQVSLPRSDASLDDVLLRQRELETQYEYWSSIGISYTFGSIYNNLVNPRFGD